MIRIHTFGCSLTSYHNWQYLVTNHFYNGRNNDPDGINPWQGDEIKHPTEWTHNGIHLTDYSIAGAGNDTQHIQYANSVYYGNILKDDIVLWQLSSPDRISCHNDSNINSQLITPNVFTGEEINIITKKEPDEPFPRTTTYSTLWQLNGVKRNNDKLLVMFGWDSCWGTSEKNGVMKFLKEHDIDYIEESILGWTSRHKFFKKNTDDIHPPQAGYKSFTEDCLLPKLKKLKWLD
jgi:hypothetical protein